MTWNLSDKIKSREFGDYMKEYYINTGEVKEFIRRLHEALPFLNYDFLNKLAGEKLK